MSVPEISIVVPTHDRRALLREMLLSLAMQTHPADRLEVLVVMDGCTDGTEAMLADLRVPYALRPVALPQSGASAARNHGAERARGSLLLFLDDDLLLLPEFVAEHHRVHQEQPGGVVLGRLLPSEDRNKPGWQLWEERILAKHYRALLNGRRPPAGRRLYSGNFSLRREDFLGAGGFDEDLKRGEDVELGFRLERAGVPFHHNPDAAAIHRGVRTFDSWCGSAYLYGQTDVQLSAHRGHSRVLGEVLRWYADQAAPARWAVSACQGRPRLRRAFLGGLRVGASLSHTLRLRRFANAGYGGVYKLNYWQGVIDEVGGPDRFASHWRAWRSRQRGGDGRDLASETAGSAPSDSRR